MQITVSEGYRPGCVGRIAQLHAKHYSAFSGFGLAFEAKVARELAEFCLNYQRGRDGIWLVLCKGEIEGSVAIDGSRADQGGAHLRWFITSDAIRGRGAGRQLLAHALRFADERGYGSTFLWTFSGLGAARHLYESHGFRLVHEGPGSQWGKVVVEQRFERDRS
ncbi:MAG TPA: GNAT family N-acetyltransferase [Burkholderiales bacterium]|nr:GNAT family N-acetyltransferase [Burkholderiales bacterium]